MNFLNIFFEYVVAQNYKIHFYKLQKIFSISQPSYKPKPAMDNYKLLLQYSFKLLGRQRYTIAQIKKKLISKNVGTPEVIEAVISRLKELQYLDDDVFAQLFIGDHLRRKPQGLKMLRNNLVKRGISTAIIAKTFQENPIDEVAVAREALEKKQKTLSAYSALQQKEKLYRFLMSRGFSPSTIFKVLHNFH